ncbi:MAG TPA: ABC transporter ATP-binding protein [Opitutaceae bacterium]|nr:ABC transporter ATP-binding protein [Opitutaceae bacterium]
MNAIECEHLTRTFGRTRAVDDLNLVVPSGSIFALLGANGAGKSTTLKILLNLLRPTSGRATVLGCESTRLKKEMFRKIGYVTEDMALPDWMTLDQLLDYYRPLYPQWDRALERQLRTVFDLPPNRPLKKLSRGMRMKGAFLSVLPFRPELLILDEPFSGLDPQVRDEFIEGLLEIVAADQLNTVVLSSHDISEVERLADWVGILAEGKLVVAEPMAQIQGRFRRIEVAGPGVAMRTPAVLPASWRKLVRPSDNVIQFIHDGYAGPRTEAELQAMFPGSSISSQSMALREIFLAHVRRNLAEGAAA